MGDVMLCVTGNESTLSSLAERLEAQPTLLHELRLDTIEQLNDSCYPLIERHAQHIIVCNRAKRQGGHFAGSETQRVEVLRRAQQAGARYVDVESDVDGLDAFDAKRLIVSLHDFEGVPTDLAERVAAMQALQPAVIKVALSITDVTQLDELLKLRRLIAGDAVVIAMGAAGQLSRVRYGRFGSKWTYVAYRPQLSTALGQLNLASARRQGLPDSASAPFFALVGGPQVCHSPGAHTYGGMFRSFGSDLSYLPVVTSHLPRAAAMLLDLGARGLSVTMPLKQQALELCEPAPLARQVGAVNTLWPTPDGWRGSNTDVWGVKNPIKRALENAGLNPAHTRALLLGSGGAARAAALALQQLRVHCTVAARRPETVGFGDASCAWSQRLMTPFDVLINATPIAGSETPIDAELLEPQHIVFDLALAPRSRLLEDARAAHATTIPATEMWLEQGLAQMRLLLSGRPEQQQINALSAQQLREWLPTELAST